MSSPFYCAACNVVFRATKSNKNGSTVYPHCPNCLSNTWVKGVRKDSTAKKLRERYLKHKL